MKTRNTCMCRWSAGFHLTAFKESIHPRGAHLLVLCNEIEPKGRVGYLGGKTRGRSHSPSVRRRPGAGRSRKPSPDGGSLAIREQAGQQGDRLEAVAVRRRMRPCGGRPIYPDNKNIWKGYAGSPLLASTPAAARVQLGREPDRSPRYCRCRSSHTQFFASSDALMSTQLLLRCTASPITRRLSSLS